METPQTEANIPQEQEQRKETLTVAGSPHHLIDHDDVLLCYGSNSLSGWCYAA